MDKQEVVICNNLKQDLNIALNKYSFDRLFVLTDDYTHKLCLPLLNETGLFDQVAILQIKAGDIHKNIDSLITIWQELSNNRATRHSLLLNLGGGMITDIGGFAAATFKRGIRYINIPTTLLSMVDASIGGKTGINFNGLKNEIGAFVSPSSVLIEVDFLKTQERHNFLSGYAEILKHGLISSTSDWSELITFDTEQIDYSKLKQLISKSITIKERIVEQDPFERNIRKALNLGHTVGHAFESFALKEDRPILHGYAVAWGMVCELYYSHLKVEFPKDKLRQTINFIKENYGSFSFKCQDYDSLYQLMLHDKKNLGDNINLTLLEDIGRFKIDQIADKENVFDMLDFYRECM